MFMLTNNLIDKLHIKTHFKEKVILLKEQSWDIINLPLKSLYIEKP